MLLDIMPKCKVLKYEKEDQIVGINRELIAWVEPHPDGTSCTLHMSGAHPVQVALTIQQVDKYLRPRSTPA